MENPIGALDQFCRAKKITFPKYTFERIGDKWKCSSQLSEDISYEGSKKKAKRELAKILFQLIIEKEISPEKPQLNTLEKNKVILKDFFKNDMEVGDEFTCFEIIAKIEDLKKVTLTKKQCNQAIYNIALEGDVRRELRDVDNKKIVYWKKAHSL